ncbi:MAG: hypothetical protein L3J34_04110 [Flavobacteriaceae bacterium]|nr:hypothetical protein [Flavobacteriaceae bacterium]
MLKNKLIQVRLNDSQFNQIIEKAESKNQSVSEYAREILLHPVINIVDEKSESDPKIPVFQRPEFIKVVIWIYSKKDGLNNDNSIDEANLYESLIDSFIMDLEPKYLDYFFIVKKGLSKIIKEYSPLYGVKYGFNKSYDNTYFDYAAFEKMILNDLM